MSLFQSEAEQIQKIDAAAENAAKEAESEKPVSYTHLLAGVDLKEGKTSPPKRFTEDLLLSAMESASSDEFPAGVEHKGIGTPVSYTHLDVYKRQEMTCLQA